jgi:hypothetical protein
MRSFYNPKRQKDGVAGDQMISGGRQRTLGKGQDIHEQDTVQNYDIGTRLVMDDRVFRYCKAGGDLVAMYAGHCGVMPREGNVDAVDYLVGGFTITIPVNTLGAKAAEEVAKDYWKEGYIWIQTEPKQLIRIKSNAAAVNTAGLFITLTLWEALKVQVLGTGSGTDRWITAWANLYSDILPGGSGKMSNVAIPLISVTSGSYFWGQTWGPCFGTQTSTKPGLASGDREIYFGADGALVTGGDVKNTGLAQRAGFLITNTSPWSKDGGGDEAGGDQFYMLSLSP